MSPTATGQLDPREDGWIVFRRTFRAPIADVWKAVTEPARLERWIGTWDGDPAEGKVSFRMTAEGDDAEPADYASHACREPEHLAVSSEFGGTLWELRLDLAEEDGDTTLLFAQRMADPELASSVGPGWDYYLDRLVAAESGQPVDGVVWDDYYPALAEHYRGQLT